MAAIRAYVLVGASIGKARDVVKALKNLEGVESADVVTGPYDIIAVVAGRNMGTIADLVTMKIGAVQGVASTVTCVVLPGRKVHQV